MIPPAARPRLFLFMSARTNTRRGSEGRAKFVMGWTPHFSFYDYGDGNGWIPDTFTLRCDFIGQTVVEQSKFV